MNREQTAALPATLTTRQAAELAGVDPQTIRSMCQRGEIRAAKLGSDRRSTWRVNTSDLLHKLALD